MTILYPTFKEYLKLKHDEIFGEDDKDALVSHFTLWFETLDPRPLSEYAQAWGELLLKQTRV